MSGSLGFSDNFLNNLAHPQVLNPLAATQQANQVAQGVWANRQNQANMLAGQAFQNSLNPDGSPNQAKLNQNLQAAGPQGALAAQTASQAGVTNASGNFDLHMKQLTSLSNSMSTVAAQNPGGVPQDVASAAVDREVQGGLITPQIGATFKSQLTADPVQNSRVILQAHIANLNAQDALHASQPSPQQQDTGGNIRTIDTNPITNQGGPGSVGTSVQPTVSPATAGSQVTWKNGAGADQYGTYAQYATERGLGHVITPPTPSAGAPGGVAPPGNGRLPPLATPTAAPPGATAQPAAPPPAAGWNSNQAPDAQSGTPPPNGQGFTNTSFPARAPASPAPTPAVSQPTPAAATPGAYTSTSGPSPGIAGAADTTAIQGAQMGTELVKRADQVPQNKAQYANMMADLGRLGTMGPGTEKETLANGLVQKLTGYGITMTPEQIASGESFAKISNQMIASQVGALGPSDSRQALAMGGTPHLDLSKQGNTEIIHVLQGNEDAIAAKSQAWQNWTKPVAQGGQGNSPGSYGQFSTDFNHNFDPRVFQAQYMGPSEIANLRASMKGQPGAEAKFMQNHAYAQQQGWIK